MLVLCRDLILIIKSRVIIQKNSFVYSFVKTIRNYSHVDSFLAFKTNKNESESLVDNCIDFWKLNHFSWFLKSKNEQKHVTCNKIKNTCICSMLKKITKSTIPFKTKRARICRGVARDSKLRQEICHKPRKWMFLLNWYAPFEKVESIHRFSSRMTNMQMRFNKFTKCVSTEHPEFVKVLFISAYNSILIVTESFKAFSLSSIPSISAARYSPLSSSESRCVIKK